MADAGLRSLHSVADRLTPEGFQLLPAAVKDPPGRRAELTVIPLIEAVVQQQHDASIGFGADDPAGCLGDLLHSRQLIGIAESLSVAFLPVGPERFLPGMRKDHPYIRLYNERKMILCVGQGAWEEDGVRSLKYLESVFREKGINAWCDFWGCDVNHDWPWWFRQMRYFLPYMLGDQ